MNKLVRLFTVLAIVAGFAGNLSAASFLGGIKQAETECKWCYYAGPQLAVRRHERENCPAMLVDLEALLGKEGMKRFVCLTCKARFAQANVLKAHMVRHSDNKLLFACSMCSKKYRYRASLSRHISQQHATSPGESADAGGSDGAGDAVNDGEAGAEDAV